MHDQALFEYGRVAYQHLVAFRRKWVVGNRMDEDLRESRDASAVADLNTRVKAVWDMRFTPIDRIAAAKLVLAAGLLMIAVVLSRISVADLLQ